MLTGPLYYVQFYNEEQRKVLRENMNISLLRFKTAIVWPFPIFVGVVLDVIAL